MTKRINIVLPDDTLRLLDKVAPRGNRSRLISEAVRHYLSSKARRNLAARLKQGATVNAQRDLNIAQEWFSVDEEAWPAKRSASGKT
jgi:CopG family transcriptional regulator / antitoxin EndoAI